MKMTANTTPPTRKSTTTNSMSAISQLLLARFWPNYEDRSLGPPWTDFNCNGNICPGDICPYQEYLSCYWPDFDQTLKSRFLGPSWTNFFCHGYICPGNISHRKTSWNPRGLKKTLKPRWLYNVAHYFQIFVNHFLCYTETNEQSYQRVE